MLASGPEFEILLVVGIDAVGIARFPRLLHEAGCRVTLFAPPRLAVVRSRYVASHVAASAEPEALATQLKAFLAEPGRAFHHIVVGDEPTLATIASHRGEAWLDGWFPVDHRSHVIEEMLSKSAFQQAAVAAGLNMPRCEICHGFHEVEAAAQDMGYPDMLKSPHGCSGSGVRKVSCYPELRPAFEALDEGDGVEIVQQFLDGPVGSTDVLFDHGTPVCWQSWYSRLCWPTPLASSCARELMHHRDVEPMVAGVGRLTGFHGFAGVDWIHDTAKDRLFLIEFNPRPTPSYHLDTRSGVSFARAFRAMLAGGRQIFPPAPVEGEAPFVYLFPQSLYRALSERESNSFFRCWADAPWSDPWLMAAYLRRVMTHYLPMRWRKAAKRLLGR